MNVCVDTGDSHTLSAAYLMPMQTIHVCSICGTQGRRAILGVDKPVGKSSSSSNRKSLRGSRRIITAQQLTDFCLRLLPAGPRAVIVLREPIWFRSNGSIPILSQ